MSVEEAHPVLIRNKHNKKYLSIQGSYDQERNGIYVRSSDGSNINISAGLNVGFASWGVDIPLVSMDKAKWKMHPGSNGQYQIINADTGEPLYAGADHLAYDKERRRVFTWKPRGYDEESWRYWTLEKCYDIYYIIKSVQYGEYLYAADYPSSGNVFTWREQKQEWFNDKFYWQLINA